jgi:hypothetical protein
MEEKTIKTYITYFDDNQIEEYGLKEDENTVLFKGNDTSYSGQSINHLNTFYCELCTMYYVWKNNLKSDYVVLKQYRRPFDWESVGKLPDKGEVISFKPILFKVPVSYQYAICHGKKRAYSLLRILKDGGEECKEAYEYFTNGKTLYTNNSMVINWEDFCDMCDFVFGILDKIDNVYGLQYKPNKYFINAKEFTEDGRYDYQTHWVAYIGERLVSCYIYNRLSPLHVNRLEGNGFYKPYEQK